MFKNNAKVFSVVFLDNESIEEGSRRRGIDKRSWRRVECMLRGRLTYTTIMVETIPLIAKVCSESGVLSPLLSNLVMNELL